MERVENCVCFGCSALCDDIICEVEDEKIISVKNVCLWGLSRFMGKKRFSELKRERVFSPLLRKGKRLLPISYDEAFHIACSYIKEAKSVLFYGLLSTSFESQLAIFDLFLEKDGILCPENGYVFDMICKMQKNPLFSTSTFEEIRNEYDTIVFWGCNPLHSCPRNLSRYTLFARGLFRERGFEDRNCYTFDIQKTEMEKVGKLFLVESLKDSERLSESDISELFKKIEVSSGVAIFLGYGFFRGGKKRLDMLFEILSKVKERTKFSIIPFINQYNFFGIINASLLKLSDFPPFLKRGKKISRIHTFDFLNLFKDVDIAFVLGADPLWWYDEKIEFEKPLIVVDPYLSRTAARSTLFIPSALLGIESEGNAFRTDNLPFFGKKIVSSKFMSDEEIVRRIMNGI